MMPIKKTKEIELPQNYKRKSVSKGPPNVEEKHYSQQELEMESKIADYFQMNCDLCMHRFESWNDTRSHYLDRH